MIIVIMCVKSVVINNSYCHTDFVCVMEMGVFHLELRLCNKSGVTDEACQVYKL